MRLEFSLFWGVLLIDVRDRFQVFLVIFLRYSGQAFALGDEQEESTPDEGLLTMTLLKHQVWILVIYPSY